MGRSRYKFHENYYPYFITSSIVGGLPLFMNPTVAKVILEALKYLQEENEVTLFGYVMMPNHIHLIAEDEQISQKFRAFKSFTARAIIDYLKEKNQERFLRQLKSKKLKNHRDSEHQVWREGVHPKQLFTPDMLIQKLEYIHFNPVKAGFVEKPVDWRYSSAVDYEGGTGLIPVTLFSG